MIKTLLKYLDFDEGTFIECGANDGVFQSNTVDLERTRGWEGLLIEPSRPAYEACLKTRSRQNLILNCALVEPELHGTEVFGDFDGNPMSSIGGHRLNRTNLTGVIGYTLESIWVKYGFEQVDLFSLDVEGYEMNVLRGLDLKVHRPSYVLIEIYNKDFMTIVNHMLKHSYALIGNLSGFTKETHPQWDGTHNDYLFRTT